MHAGGDRGGRGRVRTGQTRHQAPSQWVGQQLTQHERLVRRLLGLARQATSPVCSQDGRKKAMHACKRFEELAEGT
eukprot:15430301-Alexandrium_andersonii.AAC.1